MSMVGERPMVKDPGPSEFDSSRAELFEALGHPIRMKILQYLGETELSFSELKRKVGIESGGHLNFHLGKLDGLVRTTAEGYYVLTDDGREALMLQEIMGRTKEREAIEMSRDCFMEDMFKRFKMTIILVAIIIVASLIWSAFMPFDTVQKITMGIMISDAVIASALLTVLWIRWISASGKEGPT
jgi:DNA-binding transcriptional ArsR family regulator